MTPQEFEDKVVKDLIRAGIQYGWLILAGDKVRIG